MQKSKLTLLAALLCVGTAAPAMAAWTTIGSVNVDSRRDRDVESFSFGGPVDRLQLRAEGNDVMCRSIDATFRNGQTRSIFNGLLRQNSATNIDVPGNRRVISRLTFNCGVDRAEFGRDRDDRRDRRDDRRADGRGPATITIIADVDRYREDWRRNPDFERTWSRVFNWGSTMFNDWRMIGTERFDGRNDSESTFAGPRGRRIDAIALKPVGADARCSRVSARFDNGQDRNLGVNNGDVLRNGQYYKLDLPGNYRNLDSLNMRCSAVNGRSVAIQIFTSR